MRPLSATAFLVGFVLFPTCARVRTLQVACQHRHEGPSKTAMKYPKIPPRLDHHYIIKHHKTISKHVEMPDSVWLQVWLWVDSVDSSVELSHAMSETCGVLIVLEHIRTHWQPAWRPLCCDSPFQKRQDLQILFLRTAPCTMGSSRSRLRWEWIFVARALRQLFIGQT